MQLDPLIFSFLFSFLAFLLFLLCDTNIHYMFLEVFFFFNGLPFLFMFASLIRMECISLYEMRQGDNFFPQINNFPKAMY